MIRCTNKRLAGLKGEQHPDENVIKTMLLIIMQEVTDDDQAEVMSKLGS